MIVVFFVPNPDYFITHRARFAQACVARGDDVYLISDRVLPSSQSTLNTLGITLFEIPGLKSNSLRPDRALFLIWTIQNIYRTVKPDIVHHVALKATLLGTLAAWITRFFQKKSPTIINALGGLGFLYTVHHARALTRRTRFKKILARCIVRQFLWCCRFTQTRFIVQNHQDFQDLKQSGQSEKNLYYIPGNGINPNYYQPIPTSPGSRAGLQIVFVSRMLKDKGLVELIMACAALKQSGYNIHCHCYGAPDLENPTSLTVDTLRDYHHQHIIRWHGPIADPRRAYAKADLVILPSYREGFPKALLEAASCGKPIITTHISGCEKLVYPKINGLLVPPKNIPALIQAILFFIQHPRALHTMGAASRQIVLRHYPESVIFPKFFEIYDKINKY